MVLHFDFIGYSTASLHVTMHAHVEMAVSASEAL